MHNYLDIMVLFLAVVFGIMGAQRGFIRELFRFIALLGGFFTGFVYYRDLQELISFIPFPPQMSALIAFLIVYLIAALAILGAGIMIRKIVHFTMLGWLDRLLGITFGMLKTTIIAWAACLSLASIPSGNIRGELHRSIVFRIYTVLPQALSLEGMERTRIKIRYFYNKESRERLQRGLNVIDDFRNSIDSAKTGHSESTE